jgi:hypothetical protein
LRGAAHAQHQPADREAEGDLADEDQREGADRRSPRERAGHHGGDGGAV